MFDIKLIHIPENLPPAITELFTLNKQVHNYDTSDDEELHASKINTTIKGSSKISRQARICIPRSIKHEISMNSLKGQSIKSRLNFRSSENLAPSPAAYCTAYKMSYCFRIL